VSALLRPSGRRVRAIIGTRCTHTISIVLRTLIRFVPRSMIPRRIHSQRSSNVEADDLSKKPSREPRLFAGEINGLLFSPTAQQRRGEQTTMHQHTKYLANA
jgi:hypothetical protein